MKDLCLKFANEAEAKPFLFKSVEVPEGEPEQFVPVFRNVDVIGSIFRPTGEVDAEGNAVLADVGGWHVNVLAFDDEDVSALEPFVVVPAKRQRIWA